MVAQLCAEKGHRLPQWNGDGDRLVPLERRGDQEIRPCHDEGHDVCDPSASLYTNHGQGDDT